MRDLVNRFHTRVSQGAADRSAIAALRVQAFGLIPGTSGAWDQLDEKATHILVEDECGALCAALRLNLHNPAKLADQAYTSRFFDLRGLTGKAKRPMEVGRLCMAEGQGDATVLRLLWAEMTAQIVGQRADLLFGPFSLHGTDPGPHVDVLAYLNSSHACPKSWDLAPLPGMRIVPAEELPKPSKRARAGLPALLRSYLALGAVTCPDAVIDPEFSTCIVLTVVDVAAIPEGRRRVLLNCARAGQSDPL